MSLKNVCQLPFKIYITRFSLPILTVPLLSISIELENDYEDMDFNSEPFLQYFSGERAQQL